VVESDFATVELPPVQVDLAVCATAWHWLDPRAAIHRLAGLVRPGGWLAVWWTVFGDADRRSGLAIGPRRNLRAVPARRAPRPRRRAAPLQTEAAAPN